MRFDLTDLRLFRHVAETGSITHGAERSHLALASASARIRGMEEMLDVPLLQRGRRGVRLTDAGRSLLDHARIVLQQVDTMRGELSAYSRGLKGSVRVLANTAALSEHLPRLLADFLAANPTIDLDLEDRESPAIAAAVAAGDADIGIASQAALAAGLESHPFRPDRLVLIVPAGHRLGVGGSWALPNCSTSTLSACRAAPPSTGTSRCRRPDSAACCRLRVRVSSLDAVCAMVAAGVGVGIVPEAAARRQRRGLPLGIVRIAEPWANRELMLCVRD